MKINKNIILLSCVHLSTHTHTTPQAFLLRESKKLMEAPHWQSSWNVWSGGNDNGMAQWQAQSGPFPGSHGVQLQPPTKKAITIELHVSCRLVSSPPTGQLLSQEI